MTDRITAPMVLQTLGGFLLTICLGIAAFGLKTAINNSDRLTAIEANRFTVKHGAELWREIARIRETMAALPDDPSQDIKDLQRSMDRLLAVKPSDVMKEVSLLRKELRELRAEIDKQRGGR